MAKETKRERLARQRAERKQKETAEAVSHSQTEEEIISEPEEAEEVDISNESENNGGTDEE